MTNIINYNLEKRAAKQIAKDAVRRLREDDSPAASIELDSIISYLEKTGNKPESIGTSHEELEAMKKKIAERFELEMRRRGLDIAKYIIADDKVE